MTTANPEIVPLQADLLGDSHQPALVVLHGMLGSRRNWATMAKRLAGHFAVWAVDLRNHGSSPHHATMNYPAMAGDLGAFLAREGIRHPILVGHSMGGKVAMRYAVDHGSEVAGLVVVDISPKPYPPRWEHEFAALRRLDLARLTSRAEAEEGLATDIPDWAFRKFLTTNLVRDPQTKGFRWAVNLDALQAALPELFRKGIDPTEGFSGPTLFLRGARSRFISPDDLGLIQGHFPHAALETVADAGHNVHFDQPDAFADALLRWVAVQNLTTA